MVKVPSSVPEDIRHMAEYLSWDDAAQLRCFLESTAIENRNNPKIYKKSMDMADVMSELMRALPFNWDPPQNNNLIRKELLKATAELWREYTAGNQEHM